MSKTSKFRFFLIVCWMNLIALDANAYLQESPVLDARFNQLTWDLLNPQTLKSINLSEVYKQIVQQEEAIIQAHAKLVPFSFEHIQTWKDQSLQLQAAYDKNNLLSLSFLLAEGLNLAQKLLTKFNPSGLDKIQTGLYLELLTHIAGYKEHIKDFTQGHDYKRHMSFDKFFSSLKKLVQYIQSKKADLLSQQMLFSKDLKKRVPQNLHTGKAERLFGYIDTFGLDVSKSLASPSSPAFLPRLALSFMDTQKRKQGCTPFSYLVQVTCHGAERIKDAHVSIHGMHNWKSSSPQDQVITIFAPNHADPIQDALIMGQLPFPKDYLLLAAVENIFPKPIAKSFKGQSGMIAVAHARKPVDEIKEMLSTGVSRNMLIYPQGNLDPIQGLLPVRVNFERKLLAEIIAMGLKIQIVPITTQLNPRFLWQETVCDQKEMGAIISQTITPDLVEDLMEHKALGLYLRSIWMQNKTTDASQIFGQIRLQKAWQQMLDYIGLKYF